MTLNTISSVVFFAFGSVWCACHNHPYPNTINSTASFSKISCLAFLDVWDGDLYFVDGPHIANIVNPHLRKKALTCYDALLLVPQEANQPASPPMRRRHVVKEKSHKAKTTRFKKWPGSRIPTWQDNNQGNGETPCHVGTPRLVTWPCHCHPIPSHPITESPTTLSTFSPSLHRGPVHRPIEEIDRQGSRWGIDARATEGAP